MKAVLAPSKLLPNPVCYALPVTADEERRITQQITWFAWDDELIRASRNGPLLLVIFSEPLDLDAQNRLGAILGRDVVAVPASSVSDWRMVHEFNPESC